MEHNFLNFTEKQKDEPIYRVISINRLFQLFETRHNVLVKPIKWEDPFEKFICESITNLKFEDEKNSTVGFRDDLFGQCWTRTRESDAMWRIYSPNKNGVRISTTPRKLLSSLFYNTGEDYRNISCYIGKVKYFKTSELITHINQNVDNWVYNDVNGGGIANSLLFKRSAFKHENEVRLIYNSKFGRRNNSEVHQYSIKPLELIKDIIFDPRIEYSEFKRHKKNLVYHKFDPEKIIKSVLYNIPDFIIESQIFKNEKF